MTAVPAHLARALRRQRLEGGSGRQVESPVTPGVLAAVLDELDRALELHPDWPADPFHSVAFVNEEIGEMNRALAQGAYEPAKNRLEYGMGVLGSVVHRGYAGEGERYPAESTEAIQAAVALLRFIANLDRERVGPAPMLGAGVNHSEVEGGARDSGLDFNSTGAARGLVLAGEQVILSDNYSDRSAATILTSCR